MLHIFVETLFSFKYVTGKHSFLGFGTWNELRKYILANVHYFISEVKYVHSKIEHGQFNVNALTKLRKQFNSEIKRKISSSNSSWVQIYQFLQSVFDNVKLFTSIHKNEFYRIDVSKEHLERSSTYQELPKEKPINQRSVVDLDRYINTNKKNNKNILNPVLKAK